MRNPTPPTLIAYSTHVPLREKFKLGSHHSSVVSLQSKMDHLDDHRSRFMGSMID